MQPDITNIDIDQLQKNKTELEEKLKLEEDDFVNFAINSLDPSFFKESKLKTREQKEEESREHIRENLTLYKHDIEQGIEFFKEKALDSEQYQLGEIFGKYTTLGNEFLGKSEGKKITIEDLEFLERIAKRSLVKNELIAASCMFRFLLQMQPLYGPAWVGWAVCEQEHGNFDVVEQLYEAALLIIPNDFFVRYYAAEFYKLINKTEKAKEILQGTLEILSQDGKENSHAFEEVKLLMSSL